MLEIEMETEEILEFAVPKTEGGEGTSDYRKLANKPQINNVELSGNKTLEELGIQETLVSRENIKTINNQSLLGEGNINIQDFIMIENPDNEPNLREKLLSAIDENGNIIKPLYMMLGNYSLSLTVVEKYGEGNIFRFHRNTLISVFDEGAKLDVGENYIIVPDDENEVMVFDGSDVEIPDMYMLDQKANKIKIENSDATTLAIEPNKYYQFGEVTELNITLISPIDATMLNEYMFEFISGATATTLTLPDTIRWLEEPTIEASKTYQCSIVNNIGVLLGV